jgi:protoheme IX farnesyltransferase
MLPVTSGAKATRNQILLYTLIMAPVGLAPLLTGLGGLIYAIIGGALTLAFIYFAVKVWRSEAGDASAGDAERKLAMGMFAFSILYLFGLFAALIIEHGFGLYFPIGGL